MSTTNVRATKQAQGSNNDAWGTVANQQVFDVLDQGFSYLPLAITDADQSYTIPEGSISAAGNEARSLSIEISGSLTADRTVTLLPASSTKTWIVKNSTTGGFDVVLTNGSGATVTVSPAETVIVGGISGGGLATLLDTSALSGGGSGVPTSRNVATGAGLGGGGDLSADRTLTLDVNSLASGTPSGGDFLPYGTGSVTRRASIPTVLRYGMNGLPLEGTSGDVTEVFVVANGQPKRIAIGDFPGGVGGGATYDDSDVESYLTSLGTTASQNQITHQVGVVNGSLARIPITKLPALFGFGDISSLDGGHRFIVGKTDGTADPRTISLADLASEIEPFISVSLPSVATTSRLTVDDTLDVDSTDALPFRVRDGGSTYFSVSGTGQTACVNLNVTGVFSADVNVLDFGGASVSLESASSSGDVLGAESGFLTVEVDGSTKRIKLHNPL